MMAETTRILVRLEVFGVYDAPQAAVYAVVFFFFKQKTAYEI